MIQRPAHMAAGIAGLEAPCKHHVERGAGDDAELPRNGNGTGEHPIGYSNTHPTLYDFRIKHLDQPQPSHKKGLKSQLNLHKANSELKIIVYPRRPVRISQPYFPPSAARKNGAVRLSLLRATCSGVPLATTCPPSMT